MTELGQMLRDARESRGISLAEVEEATRIRRKYIQALEEGNYDDLPPNVYVRGFLRSYASFLGLDPEVVLAAFRDGAQVHAASKEPHIISEPLVPGSRVNWELIASVLMLIAVGVILVLVYRQYIAPLAASDASARSLQSRHASPPRPRADASPAGPPPTVIAAESEAAPGDTSVQALSVAPTATPTTAATLTPPPPTPAPPTATTTPTRQPTATRTPTPEFARELTLGLKVTGRAWVRVVSDGQTVFEGTVNPGDEPSWTASREILLRTGNAGGVVALINGRELGTLGNPGQVIDFVWRLSDTGEVLMGTPTP